MALILSRKRDESIKIGDDVVIKVVEIKGNQVRLAIEAPAHIRVLRAELPVIPATEVPQRG
jgi:carbon storage regulator